MTAMTKGATPYTSMLVIYNQTPRLSVKFIFLADKRTQICMQYYRQAT
jgi:hypothetical protein